MNITKEATAIEKKKELYDKQMELLQMFRERGAISEEQYQKSSKDLTEKMGFSNGKESE